MYVCMYVYIHTFMHTYIYVHTHTHIHTNIHTYIPVEARCSWGKGCAVNASEACDGVAVTQEVEGMGGQGRQTCAACMYICMYVCVYIYIYIYIYAYVYVCGKHVMVWL